MAEPLSDGRNQVPERNRWLHTSRRGSVLMTVANNSGESFSVLRPAGFVYDFGIASQ